MVDLILSYRFQICCIQMRACYRKSNKLTFKLPAYFPMYLTPFQFECLRNELKDTRYSHWAESNEDLLRDYI